MDKKHRMSVDQITPSLMRSTSLIDSPNALAATTTGLYSHWNEENDGNLGNLKSFFE